MSLLFRWLDQSGRSDHSARYSPKFHLLCICRYLVSAFCGDDAFDFDEGYHGKGQFWLALQSYYLGDHLAEHDGGTNPVYGQPYCIPEIYNVTYIGNGLLTSSELMTFSDNAGGKYFNSIFLNQKKGVGIQYVLGTNDSFDQFEKGNLQIENNLFYDVVSSDSTKIFSVFSSSAADLTTQETELDNYFILNNEISDPGIEITNTYVNVVPGGIVNTNLASYPADWFEAVSYKGAIDPEGANWVYGWTLVHQSGRVL